MKCPYCSNEMEKGYLQSRDGMGWNEKERLIPALSGVLAAQQLGRTVAAYRCKNCKKIVIDYSGIMNTWGQLPDEKEGE